MLRRIQLIAVPCIIAATAWIATHHAASLRSAGSLWHLVLAFVALQASLLCFAARFGSSLRAVGIRLAMKASMVVAMQSLFYFFVPMSIGTDTARWMKIKARLPDASKAAVLAAVLLDRGVAAAACLLIGVATLARMTSVRLQIPWPNTAQKLWPILIGGCVVVVIVIPVFAALKRRLRPAFSQVSAADCIKHACMGLVLALLTQGLTIIAVWSGFRWLGADLDPLGVALGVTGGALAQVIPLSMAGAGAGEVTAGLLLAATGATADQALVLASMVYFCKLVGGIEGGILEWPPVARKLFR